MYIIKKLCFNWRFLKKNCQTPFFRYFKKIYYESEINKKNV